jgi:hypothetical protein
MSSEKEAKRPAKVTTDKQTPIFIQSLCRFYSGFNTARAWRQTRMNEAGALLAARIQHRVLPALPFTVPGVVRRF